jgi:hypothetical protein
MTESIESPGTIVRLEVDNIKRLRAVRIEPDGSLIIVSGKNDQGKSSVLDAIRFGLGGPAAMKDTPNVVRNGEVAGKVVIEFDDLVLTRTMTDGKHALKLNSKSGKAHKSPQAMLDQFLTSLTFDPLKFAQLDAKKQRSTLIGLVDLGFDPDDIDGQIQTAYDLRTETNRKVSEMQGAISSAPVIPDDTPDEEIAAADLLAEMDAARTQNGQREQLAESIGTREVTVTNLRGRIAQIQQQLDEAKDLVARHEAALSSDMKRLDDMPAPIDLEPLRERVAGVDTINGHVRNKLRLKTMREQLEKTQLKSKGYTTEIDALNQKKTDALAAAKMPIEGLSFTADGVTYKGDPLSQVSESGRTKVSAAIQMALNPGCKIMLIDNGNALDEDNLAVLESMAQEHGHQIWMTWVGTSDASSVVISDGEVVGY